MSASLRRLCVLCLVWPLLAPVSGATTDVAPAHVHDPREAYREGQSPGWLRAVGRLEVPGIRYEKGRRRHHTERCSATLVSARRSAPADIIVTAWHCLEFYEDLSRRILFILSTAEGEALEIEATRVADGGGMAQDWAILRLGRAVSRGDVPALHPGSQRMSSQQPLVMAGFSRDKGLGQEGARLSYDPHCRVTGSGQGYTDSDCRAFKGASGGAVIQVDERGEPRFSGVISQGDGAGLSRFVPVAVFKATLSNYLQR